MPANNSSTHGDRRPAHVHEQNQAGAQAQTRERTVEELVSMTSDEITSVLEVKPEIKVTVTIPKEEGGNVSQTVTAAFTSLDWVRYVEIRDELEIVPTETELHIEGTFYLTAHFPPSAADDEQIDPETVVHDRIQTPDFIRAVHNIELRMPPYQTQAY